MKFSPYHYNRLPFTADVMVVLVQKRVQQAHLNPYSASIYRHEDVCFLSLLHNIKMQSRLLSP